MAEGSGAGEKSLPFGVVPCMFCREDMKLLRSWADPWQPGYQATLVLVLVVLGSLETKVLRCRRGSGPMKKKTTDSSEDWCTSLVCRSLD